MIRALRYRPWRTEPPWGGSDRVGVEEAFQVLRLELQILVFCNRERILAVDGVERSHG